MIFKDSKEFMNVFLKEDAVLSHNVNDFIENAVHLIEYVHSTYTEEHPYGSIDEVKSDISNFIALTAHQLIQFGLGVKDGILMDLIHRSGVDLDEIS